MWNGAGTQAVATVRSPLILMLGAVLLWGCERRSEWSANSVISAQLADAAIRQSMEYDEQLKRVDEQLRKTDEHNRRIDAILDSTLVQSERIDRLLERWERLTGILEVMADAAGAHAQPPPAKDE